MRGAHLNLAYRWFCRLGLQEAVPDHSTLSKSRHGRFRDGDLFRRVFESLLARCMAAGLVGGEGFAVDASLIESDANRSRSMAREGVPNLRDPHHATRAVREYPAALDAQGEPGTPAASISPTDPAALVFPSSLLARPIPGADPAVRRAVEALADELERQGSHVVGPAVRRALRAMLVAGDASEDGVAAAFAMHRRTLNRRLRGEGTTFRLLVEETRLEVARQLLRDTDAAVAQIAIGLGYSGPTAFGRAFKRWSGLAPQAWRDGGERRAGG